MEAAIEYDFSLVAAAVLIAVVASTAALWLALNTHVFSARMAAAGVMAVAVCAMHYTAMAAARFLPHEATSTITVAQQGFGAPSFLVTAIIVATVIVLCLGTAASYVDQRFAFQQRCIADDLAVSNNNLMQEIAARQGVQRDLATAHKALADQRFDRLAGSMATGLLCADENGVITSWNQAAEAIFGYSHDEAVGQSTEIIVPERSRAAHSAGLSRMATTGESKLAGRTVEVRALKKDGLEFPAELSLSTWTEEGRPAFGAIIRDITERHDAQQRLHVLAYTDQLTGLPNRQAFGDSLRAAVRPMKHESTGLLLLDLDGFKEVNDSHGHSAGDIVLITCADRLRDAVPEGGTVSRLGGDEFAILLPPGTNVATSVHQVLRAFEKPIVVCGQPFQLGTSIGVALYPEHASGPDEWLANADLALYRAKTQGRGRSELFTPALAQALQLRQTMEMELLRAYSRGEFELYYQPLVRLSDGALIGAEALLRWNHPERGLLSPAAFMPTLETSSLAEAVGTWVLQSACDEAVHWQSEERLVRVGVNLFAAQFRSGNLSAKVAQALKASGLEPSILELEITENIALAHDEAMIEVLQELRKLDIGIAFDDFGTGFGSLSMLKRFPVTRLKIDRSFVQDLMENDDDLGIVRAVIGLGRSLGLMVIAEGVETDEQCKRLVTLGCSEGQGYHFGKPMPASDFRSILLGVEAQQTVRVGPGRRIIA
jgi:diguanylate cyclase (GGDEF)-like protein/PAS domain S-box-containing protein